MKKILLGSIMALALASSSGFSNMMYNNNDMYDLMGFRGIGLFMGLGVAAVAIGIFLFLFWLFMLIDCLKRDFRKDVEKIAWILVLIFLHLLGAIVYYFVVKIQDKQTVKGKKK